MINSFINHLYHIPYDANFRANIIGSDEGQYSNYVIRCPREEGQGYKLIDTKYSNSLKENVELLTQMMKDHGKEFDALCFVLN